MNNKLTKPFSLSTCGRATAERYDGEPDMHVISIYTPGWGPADLRAGWGTKTFVGMNDDYMPPPQDITRIADAAIDAIANANGLLVHCEMGMSRSVGVAFAIHDFFGIPYSNSFKGNAQVHRALMEEFQNRWSLNPSLPGLYHARVE